MSRGWHSFVNGMEDFAVALAYSWMWLILWAVIIVAAVVILRKIRRHWRCFCSQKLVAKVWTTSSVTL